MSQRAELEFGVDLITFHHPGFWGVSDHAGIEALAAEDAIGFWTRILDAVQQTGLTGIELTFAPFDWAGAVRAFGSANGFRAELAARGLRLCSGFFIDLSTYSDGDDVEALIARALDYADVLKASGADIMVAGLPMRRTTGMAPVKPYDLAEALPLASVINRLAVAVAERGVRFALHTEAHSVFCTARDVDLMLLLTDPAYVHFCPDTAHLTLMGGDPLQIVERHHERVVIAHWKDAIGKMPADTVIDAQVHERHRPYFCGFGMGRVDWHGWMRLLDARQISGWAILELDAAPDPVGDLSRGLTFVRQALLR